GATNTPLSRMASAALYSTVRSFASRPCLCSSHGAFSSMYLLTRLGSSHAICSALSSSKRSSAASTSSNTRSAVSWSTPSSWPAGRLGSAPAGEPLEHGHRALDAVAQVVGQVRVDAPHQRLLRVGAVGAGGHLPQQEVAHRVHAVLPHQHLGVDHLPAGRGFA